MLSWHITDVTLLSHVTRDRVLRKRCQEFLWSADCWHVDTCQLVSLAPVTRLTSSSWGTKEERSELLSPFLPFDSSHRASQRIYFLTLGIIISVSPSLKKQIASASCTWHHETYDVISVKTGTRIKQQVTIKLWINIRYWQFAAIILIDGFWWNFERDSEKKTRIFSLTWSSWLVCTFADLLS